MIDAANECGSFGRNAKAQSDTEIVTLLAERLDVGALRKPFAFIIRADLSEQINEGAYGIQYMDPAYLVEDLLENEPEVAAIGECSQ